MIFIDEQKCTLCGVCVEACTWQALSLAEGKLAIDRDLCAECGACLRVCPADAIYEVETMPVTSVDRREPQASRPQEQTASRPVTLRSASPPVLARVTPSPLWVGVLPLAARFVGGLASWWLDRRRPAAWDRRDSSLARRGFEGRVPPAVPSTGSPGFRRRWRGGRGR